MSTQPECLILAHEKLAARFPIPDQPDNWLPVRRSDGSAVRP